MPRNVVLLCLDTVRYDYFDQYADELLATADISFSECRTASTWSVPSHASMFTEILPHEHGYHSATPSFDNLDCEETFLSDLDGFRSVGISANPYASPIFGFDSLFDEFEHITSSMSFADGLSPSKFWHESSTEDWTRYIEFLKSCLQHDYPARSLANGASSQVEKLFQNLPIAKPFDDGCKRVLSHIRSALGETSQPTFVFANIMDAHGPLANVRGYDQSLISDEHQGYAPDIDALSLNMDDSFDEYGDEIAAYRDLYAAAVEYTTRQVAKFCRRVDDDTAVIVTADHGEQLVDDPEKHRFGHITPDVTEPLLHVPLVVVNADLSTDESEPISHLDLGNLVTAIATETEFKRHQPIAAEVAGLGVAHPPMDHENLNYWDRVSRCVYLESGDSKYVWDSLSIASHYERNDDEYILESEGELDLLPADSTKPFHTDIEDVETREESKDLDAEVESQLEELGYL